MAKDFTKEEYKGKGYLSITPDYMKTEEGVADKPNLWEILINKLYNSNAKDVFEGIFETLDEQIDFPTNAFNDFLNDYIEEFTISDWIKISSPFWNKSWGAALLNFIKTIYPNSATLYENKFDIYVDENGNLGLSDFIFGSIPTSAGISFRKKDIKNGDAAANFGDNDENISLISYEDVMYKLSSNVQITYTFKRMDKVQEYMILLDEIAHMPEEERAPYIEQLNQIKQEYFPACDDVVYEYNKYLDNQDGFFRYIITLVDIYLAIGQEVYSLFDKDQISNPSDFLNVTFKAKDNSYNQWTYTFNNTPEDYNVTYVHALIEPIRYFKLTNPWVIPWYNIIGQTYGEVRGTDKIVSVLNSSSELQFTNLKGNWLRLIMPKYLRRVEVEDLNRNFWVIAQIITAMSAFLFDEAGGVQKALKDLTDAILDLWENTEHLWAAITMLCADPYITDIHTEIIPLTISELQPYLKYDNFDNLDSNSYRSICEARLSYLKQQYLDSNLVIIPEIRLNNYEENYYSKAIYPGIMVLNRNHKPINWEWRNMDSNNNSWIINLTSNEISYCGLLKETETVYYYCAGGAQKGIDSGRYYALLRPKYQVNTEYDLFSDEIVVSNLSISYIDIVPIITQQSNTERVVWLNNNWNTQTSSLITGEVSISQGYYQGELISYFKKLLADYTATITKIWEGDVPTGKTATIELSGGGQTYSGTVTKEANSNSSQLSFSLPKDETVYTLSETLPDTASEKWDKEFSTYQINKNLTNAIIKNKIYNISEADAEFRVVRIGDFYPTTLLANRSLTAVTNTATAAQPFDIATQGYGAYVVLKGASESWAGFLNNLLRFYSYNDQSWCKASELTSAYLDSQSIRYVNTLISNGVFDGTKDWIFATKFGTGFWVGDSGSQWSSGIVHALVFYSGRTRTSSVISHPRILDGYWTRNVNVFDYSNLTGSSSTSQWRRLSFSCDHIYIRYENNTPVGFKMEGGKVKWYDHWRDLGKPVSSSTERPVADMTMSGQDLIFSNQSNPAVPDSDPHKITQMTVEVVYNSSSIFFLDQDTHIVTQRADLSTGGPIRLKAGTFTQGYTYEDEQHNILSEGVWLSAPNAANFYVD